MSDKEKREAAKAALKDQSKKRKAHVLSITAVIPGGGKGLPKAVRKGRRKAKKAQAGAKAVKAMGLSARGPDMGTEDEEKKK